MTRHTRDEIIEKYRKMRDTAKLTQREMQIFELRYGLADGSSRTLEKVAQVFGVTRERIRQIEAKIIWKIGLNDADNENPA